MVDLLGAADAGASPTLSTTTDVTSPVTGDTWLKDCSSSTVDDGTPINAKFVNRITQQLRAAIRASNVPLSNAYDEMLSWAIQSGYANWAGGGLFGGTANALTAAMPNAPMALEGGTVVCGLVSTSPNTGAVTLDWAGLGPQPVLMANGAALAGGELQTGWFVVMRWDGGAWRIVSPIYTPPYTPPNQNPYTMTGVGAAIDAAGDLATFAGPLWESLGQVATWAAAGGGAPANVYAIGADPQCYAADARWPSSPPPGSWEMVTASASTPGAFSTLTPTGSIVVTWVRIA